ncbi:MAG: type II toxin-antitoxin system RelB/DinJ family antitoxin [Anaerolineales bacterium]|nr:type II toxin-antitoxin system RelB/DinJ family antitoxin [Anaerolineales bacterium]
MAKTSVISARINPELKNNVEQVFQELGLTATQAITMFYKQVELQRGLPFIVKIPNDVTSQALREARSRYDLEDFNTVEDLFDDLGI